MAILRLLVCSYFFCVVNVARAYISDTQSIVDKGTLVVATTSFDRVPFFMKKADGSFEGIEFDIAQAIAKELGVKLVIDNEADSYNGVVDRVAEGAADLGISKISITLKRAKKVNYTAPYFDFSKGLLFNRLVFARNKKLENESAASYFSRGHKIGCIRNSSYQAFASYLFPNATVVPFDSWYEAVEAVEKGQVTAIFRDEFEVGRQLRRLPKGTLRFLAVDIKGGKDLIGMVVPHHKQHFLNWVNQFLRDRAADVKKSTEELLVAADKFKTGE